MESEPIFGTFQQADVLLGRSAKPGHTIPHHFYSIAHFHIRGKAKNAAFKRYFYRTKMSLLGHIRIALIYICFK